MRLKLLSWPWLHVLALCPCCLVYPMFFIFAICISEFAGIRPQADTAPPMLLTSDSRETVQPAELDVVLLTRPLDHTLLVLTANKSEQPGKNGTNKSRWPCPCVHSRHWAVVLPTPSAGSLPWKLKPKFLETGKNVHLAALSGQKMWNLYKTIHYKKICNFTWQL